MGGRQNGLRKQVTEAKEGPMELRRERQGKALTLSERGGQFLNGKSQYCDIFINVMQFQ